MSAESHRMGFQEPIRGGTIKNGIITGRLAVFHTHPIFQFVPLASPDLDSSPRTPVPAYATERVDRRASRCASTCRLINADRRLGVPDGQVTPAVAGGLGGAPVGSRQAPRHTTLSRQGCQPEPIAACR